MDFGHGMGIKFDNNSVAVKQNNYLTEVLNLCTVDDLDASPKSRTSSFKLKISLFGATNIVKNSDKEKWVYSGYGIAFNGEGARSFGNDFARDVVTFDVVNSSSSHTDNRKNNLLILGEGPAFGINGSFGSPEKKFSIKDKQSKAKGKFCWSLHYNGDNSYLFVNGQEMFKFKANNKNVNFSTQFF